MEIEQTVDENGPIIKIKKLTISLCMIVKDRGLEWVYIENCLTNLQQEINEVIILTDKSFENSDKFRELLSKYNIKFVFSEWNNSFSELRNECVKRACGDWILILDADEVILSEDIRKLKLALIQAEKITISGIING